MRREKIAVGVISVILVLGFLFAGCSSDGGEVDTWEPLSSPNDIVGTWEGSTNITIPKDLVLSEAQDPIPEIKFSRDANVPVDMKVSYAENAPNVNTTTRLGLGDVLGAILPSLGMQDTAGNRETLWTLMSSFISSTDGVTLVNESYTIVTDTAVPRADFPGQGSEITINQKKTKLKIISTDVSDVPMGNIAIKEPSVIILEKK
jgi:hypothetical protein